MCTFNELLVIVFTLGYLLVVFEHAIGVNKAASALLLGAACWVLNLLHVFPQDEWMLTRLDQHLHEISQVVLFLLGAMTIVELIDVHQGFKFINHWIRTDNKRKLLWVVAGITFFVSAVLDNLTTAIIMVTLLRRLVVDSEERVVFAGMVIIAANAGGAWTPIGDVTTTMLWIHGYISSGNIMRGLFLPSLLSVLVPLILATVFFIKGTLPRGQVRPEDATAVRGAKRVFCLGVGALVSVPILRAWVGLPPYLGIMLGLSVMWILTDRIHQEHHYLRVPHVLARIDISSILFFLGVLLAVAALQTVGVLERWAVWMDSHLKNQDMILGGMGLMSAIIDNVPLTAATMGMYSLEQFPMDAKIWTMAAYCLGTGGSILIIGSAAGVVVMGMEKIRFTWYLRKISLLALAGYLAGFFWFLLTYRLTR
jgi:Na+/H+ antiporter NhaD/arsenite permease-like protein